MSLTSTLNLLRPTLSSYVNLTKHGLIQCQRDNFQFNPNPKAPVMAQEMAKAMFAMGASSVIEGYTMSRLLSEGPKVFSFDALTCEALENFDLNVSCADYSQPFPSVVIELPKDYTERRVVPFERGTHAPDFAVVHHDPQGQVVMLIVRMSSHQVLTRLLKLDLAPTLEEVWDKVHRLVQDFKVRTGGRLMNLMTSDEYPAYQTAIFDAYAVEKPSARTGQPGRPKKPTKVVPTKLTYATVHKERKNGRVVKVTTRVVFGTVAAVVAALALSLVSKVVNCAFIERHNGSDRNRNRRKVRKTCCFSKDWVVHEAMTYFTMYSYNFCWPVRTLRVKVAKKQYEQRTPAMVAGLTDHIWTTKEWASYPAVKRLTSC